MKRKKDGRGVRFPAAPLVKAATTAAFRFLTRNSAKTVSTKFATYKPAEIVKGKDRWYIEYYYRIPIELRPLHGNKEWKRYRVFEDINRYKTDEYANTLLAAVNLALEEGYNPFKFIAKEVEQKKKGITAPEFYTVGEAMEKFITKWRKRRLEKNTLDDYLFTKNLLVEWFTIYGLINTDIKNITEDHIEKFLYDSKTKNGWGNRRFNNILRYTSTIFAYLLKKKIVDRNLCIDIELLEVQTKKHKFYDEKNLKKILDLAKQHDPYLFFAIQCVYYLCIRSEKELKNFMVKNIFPERCKVLITAGGSKTKSDRLIPLHSEMMEVFKERKILEYDDRHFVFGVESKNNFIADGKPGLVPFGHGFFSKRFYKIRKMAGLSNDYTIYGFKHTRVIHLKLDGASDAEVMGLTGHTDYVSFSKYLRDLGEATDLTRLAGLTRKI